MRIISGSILPQMDGPYENLLEKARGRSTIRVFAEVAVKNRPERADDLTKAQRYNTARCIAAPESSANFFCMRRVSG